MHAYENQHQLGTMRTIEKATTTTMSPLPAPTIKQVQDHIATMLTVAWASFVVTLSSTLISEP